jgi:hypothetical protein
MNKQQGPFINRPVFALIVFMLTAVGLIALDYVIGRGWLSDPALPARPRAHFR